MKRTYLLTGIIIVSFMIYMYLTPKVFSDTNIHDLSSKEFNYILKKAKKNHAGSIIKLLNYYNLKHKDIKSTCIVLCKITSFTTAQKGYFRLYDNYNCKKEINCTKKSLNDLVEH